MPLSNSVLRRYTPPTCTLEIVAKSSPLSRWVGKSALKDLRFELRFDDPRKPEEQRVTIRGDRTELDSLCEAVNSYVQEFLSLSSEQLPLALGTPPTATDLPPSADYRVRKTSYSELGANPFELSAAQTSEEDLDKTDHSSFDPHRESDSPLGILNPPTVATEVYLQPRGLLAHDLFLGRLSTQESGAVVNLSVLQLFDLATALDEYTTELVAVPNLNSPVSGKNALPVWAPTAAAVLVSVGVTAAVVKLLDQPKTKQQASAPTTPVLGQSPLLSQVPLAPISPGAISPLPTPVLPPSIASSPRLTPPPPVTVPPPGSFTPSARQRPTITINPSTPVPPPIAEAPQRPASTLVPGGVASSTITSNTNRSPSSSVAAKTSTRSSSGNTSAAQSKPSTVTLPPSPPPLPTLPPLQGNSSTSAASQQAAPSNVRSASALKEPNQSDAAPTGNAANSKLSDTIPQVAEVRNYFEQRWKPPSNLTQTIEYSLSLNADGSIQRILPLGKAAGDYIDRTGMPLPGEPFVSPLKGTSNPIIRLVLSPDGKVQAFME